MSGLDILSGTLIKAVVSFFMSSMITVNSVEIKGAPDWYMRESSSLICVSSYARGDYNSFNIAKNKAMDALITRISKMLNLIISEKLNNKNLYEDFNRFFDKVTKDNTLKIFILKNGNFTNLKYNSEKRIAFVRLCVLRSKLTNYEIGRIETIKKKLHRIRLKKAVDELEKNIKE